MSITIDGLVPSLVPPVDINVSNANGANVDTFGATRTASTIASQLVGGVDESLATAYVAFKFTMAGTEMGGFAINVKRDSGTSAGTITSYLYTDSAGLPNTNISDGSTGLPTILDLRFVSTGYTSFQFRLPQTGMVNGNSYWVVLNIQGLTGGNVYVERRSSGTALWATSANGSSWTGVNTKEPLYTILGNSGKAISGNSDTGDAIFGQSLSGFAGRFISSLGPGIKADSDENFGVGGTSRHGIGVRGSSNFNHAIQGVSTGLAGGQFITSAAGQPGAQMVSTSGPAIQLAPGTGAFAQFLPIDASAGGCVGTWGFIGEEITLSGGLTTDSVANLLPAGSIIDAVCWRVTTAITGIATAFQIGTAADATEFQNTVVTLIAGTSGVGMNHWLSGGHAQAVAVDTKIRITANGTTSAGKIRVIVWYRAYTAPTA